MSTLNVVLTHLPAAEVDRQLAALRRLAPEGRFAVCHGGQAADAAAVTGADCAFIADPTLRGAPRTLQGYHEVLATVQTRWLEPDTALDAVYLLEFDHLVLRAGFEAALRDLAAATGAGMLGKHLVERRGSNWQHYARFRSDPALRTLLRRVSVRDTPEAIYGTLGNGMWFTRDAVAAYAAVEDHPAVYGELYVPTLIHHLGFKVVDLDSCSDLYDHVRWDPPYAPAEVDRLAAAGATFVHPVKDPGAWDRVGTSG